MVTISIPNVYESIGLFLLIIGFCQLFSRKFTFGFFLIGISASVFIGELLREKDWEDVFYLGMFVLLNGWFFNKSKVRLESSKK